MSATLDADRYESVARSFARLSRRYTAPLAAHLVALAELGPTDRVLDLGTGTGVVALEVAARLSPPGRVLGLDIAARMLDEARAAAATAGLAQAEFRELDAQRLPLADASFDAACSLFALAHLQDPARALREAHRVLRPGAHLVLGVGSRPPLSTVEGLRARLRRVPIQLAAWRGRCRLAPGLVESLLVPGANGAAEAKPLLAPRECARLVREAGFSRPRVSWRGGEAQIGGPEEFFELAATFSTAVRLWLADASAPAAEALRRRVLSIGADVLARGGRLYYLYGACFLTARRP